MISAADQGSQKPDRSAPETESARDERIASEIRFHGRIRLERGERIELRALLKQIPDVSRYPASVDAAVDIALRSLSGGTKPTEEAVARLIAEYPSFERSIRTAVALSEALWSSETLTDAIHGVERELPCPFGPMIADGRARYELEAAIGAGSSGEVYRSVDRTLSAADRPAMVAIKVLRSTRTDAVSRARFIEEASKARLIDHPNAVRVFDRGESGEGEHYIVYELVEGGDLHSWVKDRAGRITARDAADMVRRIAGAIQAAHSAGLVHLDLKPANVLVTRAGDPKVADFGLAIRRATGAEAVPTGTLAFTAPEQHAGAPDAASPQADVYALGGLLHWLITGSLPNGATRAEIEERFASGGADPAPRLRKAWEGRPFDRDLFAICCRALAPTRADRYGTAAELASDLAAWLGRRPIAWRRPGPVRTTWLFVQRRPGTAALLTMCVILLGSAIVAMESARASEEDRRVASARADAEVEWRATAAADLQRFVVIFQGYSQSGRAGEALASLSLLEMVYGPTLVNDPNMFAMTRTERIAMVREMAEAADASAGEQSLQALELRSLLGFLLARNAQYTEADRELADAETRWAARLDADDPHLQDLAALRAASRAGIVAASAESGRATDADRAEMRSMLDTLIAQAERLSARSDGAPVRLVVLQSIYELAGPACLSDAQTEAWAIDRIKSAGVPDIAAPPVRQAIATDPD